MIPPADNRPRLNLWLCALCFFVPAWAAAVQYVEARFLGCEFRRELIAHDASRKVADGAALLACLTAAAALVVGLGVACGARSRPARVAGVALVWGCDLLLWTCSVVSGYVTSDDMSPPRLVTVTAFAALLAALWTAATWRRQSRDVHSKATVTGVRIEPAGGARAGWPLRCGAFVVPLVTLAAEMVLLSQFDLADTARLRWLAALVPLQVALAWLLYVAAPALHLSGARRVLLLRHAQGWLTAVVLMRYVALLCHFPTYYRHQYSVTMDSDTTWALEEVPAAAALVAALGLDLCGLALFVYLWRRSSRTAQFGASCSRRDFNA